MFDHLHWLDDWNNLFITLSYSNPWSFSFIDKEIIKNIYLIISLNCPLKLMIILIFMSLTYNISIVIVALSLKIVFL